MFTFAVKTVPGVSSLVIESLFNQSFTDESFTDKLNIVSMVYAVDQNHQFSC